jgi:hypothetical protein
MRSPIKILMKVAYNYHFNNCAYLNYCHYLPPLVTPSLTNVSDCSKQYLHVTIVASCNIDVMCTSYLNVVFSSTLKRIWIYDRRLLK